MLLRIHARARKPVLCRSERGAGREARCFRASTHALRCISMAASDLGPKALNVAALNDLCHLCPPWTQAGCALNAVSREVSKLAADVRRRRRRKLLALRNEIRRHTFVTLRNTTQSATCWFKIHGVRDETVAACADIIHAKSHFRAFVEFTCRCNAGHSRERREGLGQAPLLRLHVPSRRVGGEVRPVERRRRHVPRMLGRRLYDVRKVRLAGTMY